MNGIQQNFDQETGGGGYLNVLRWGEWFEAHMRRVRAQLTLQENLLAAGVAPHSKCGQIDGEVVPGLLHK